MPTPPSPPVPEQQLEAGGWVLQEERTETFFEMPMFSVSGTTRQYDDQSSREAVQAATGESLDGQIRFFAVTRVGFNPSLPLGVRPSMFLSTLRSKLREEFAGELAERGLTDIEREESDQLELPDSSRVKLDRFSAMQDISGQELPMDCWVGLWASRKEVLIVTGGYPRATLAAALDLGTEGDLLTRSREQYQDEFFSLVHGVAEADD